jgi:hypothetical protein
MCRYGAASDPRPVTFCARVRCSEVRRRTHRTRLQNVTESPSDGVHIGTSVVMLVGTTNAGRERFSLER